MKTGPRNGEVSQRVPWRQSAPLFLRTRVGGDARALRCEFAWGVYLQAVDSGPQVFEASCLFSLRLAVRFEATLQMLALFSQAP